MRTVTVETKCWSGDWQRILKGSRLQTLVERNAFDFTDRTLMINNVDDRRLVIRAADDAVRSGVLTRYIMVEDHAEEALRFFGLTADALTQGYVYSIAELVSIYLCRTEFLLHFAGDCIPISRCAWIDRAIDAMDNDPRIKVANLTWDGKYGEAEAESSSATDDFFLGFGFSDQCYFVRTADFRAAIYNESHPASARYPEYGGELFEKRVDSWMRNHRHLRATFRHGSYQHDAWSRERPVSLRSRLGRFKRLIARAVGAAR